MGILELPPFACAVTDHPDVHILVRGTGAARVTFADGRTTMVAAQAGVTTWREEVFGGVVLVELTTNDEPAIGRLELVLIPVEAAAPTTGSAAQDGLGVPEQISTSLPGVDAAFLGARAPSRSTSASDATFMPPSDLREIRGVEDPRLDGSPAPTPKADEFDFAHLLEETHYRGVEAAAVRDDAVGDAAGALSAGSESREIAGDPTRTGFMFNTAAPSEGSVVAVPEELISSVPIPPDREEPVHQPGVVMGDHDGHTVSVEALRKVRDQLAPASPRGPQVQAVFCVNGHPNPPNAPACRSCRGDIFDRSVREIDRPALGCLRMSTGASVELDRSLLVGRRPTVGGVEPSEVVGLVVVPDPDHSLSRLHAEIRLEGWEVYVVDLDSKNGTYVQIPGQSPMKLRAGEPCMVVPGTRMRLGDVVEMQYEVPGS